jgi:hypothetical protein
MTPQKNVVLQESLDQAGRLIVEASVLSEKESAEIAEAPHLFAGIRTRIAKENQQVKSSGFWSGFWPASKHAIPAMVIIAALSIGVSLYMAGNKNAPAAFSVDAYLGTNEAGIDNIVFAERRPLTRDEVLATIISRDEREAGR